MKAVYFTEHGDRSVLQYGELPAPHPGPGEVVVRVKACALNRMDLWVREGWPSLKLKMPHVLGADISGEIAELGAGVEDLQVGQEVIVSPGVSCGKCAWCLQGLDNNCAKYGIVGEHFPGGYAQFVKVPAVNIISKPENLSFNEAAAFPLTFLTSWHMLVTQAKVRPYDWVLILAAGSGVGVAAVQIARLFNANIIAAAGSDAKLQKAKDLGAEFLINYEKEDLYKKVKEMTRGKGVDLVFENIGQRTWDISIRLLSKGGRLVTCGATTGYQATTDLRYLFYKNLKIFGNLMGSKGELLKITELVAQQKLRPVIDRVYELAQAAEAHAAMEKRAQFGKIVLKIP
ncbi:MAG: alcohol dehydrogenase [Calditrichaeota bacterium]|nr:MAG: alcohol dehydrogenase [Calditrichota bacterium]